MIGSLLLAAAIAQAPAATHTTHATLAVSLRIVAPCEPGAPASACTPDAYERWLDRQVASRRRLEQPAPQVTGVAGGTVVEIVF